MPTPGRIPPEARNTGTDSLPEGAIVIGDSRSLYAPP